MKVCPNNCSGLLNGICKDGICVCNSGFGGDSCDQIVIINTNNSENSPFELPQGKKQCKHKCHNGGKCNNTTGRCLCKVNYFTYFLKFKIINE